jgi:hypothetical protein
MIFQQVAIIVHEELSDIDSERHIVQYAIWINLVYWVLRGVVSVQNLSLLNFRNRC